MKRLYILLVLAAGLALLYLACTGKEKTDSRLESADALFDVDLDSARSILSSIDTAALSKGNLAIWRLLNVRYHNYTHDPRYSDEVTPGMERDVLAHGNDRYIHEMYFWKGEEEISRHRLVDALMSFEKSAHYLGKSDYTQSDKDALHAHLLESQSTAWVLLGDRYYGNVLNDSAIRLYEKYPDSEFMMRHWAYLRKLAYLTGKEHLDADNEALGKIKNLKKERNVYDRFSRQIDVASLVPMIRSGRQNEARRVMEQLETDTSYNVYEDDESRNKYLYATALLAYIDNDYKKSRETLEALVGDGQNGGEAHVGTVFAPTCYADLLNSIYMREGDGVKLWNMAELVSGRYKKSGENESRRAAINRISKYHNELRKEAEQELRRGRIREAASGVVILLAAVSVAVWIAAMRRKMRRRAEDMLGRLDTLRIQDEERRRSIHELTARRFETFNRMCDDYFELSEMKDKTALKNELVKNLSDQIKEMRGEKFRASLEENVDRDLDGVMRKFRTLTDAGKEDTMLFLYLASGFSMKAVGVFLELRKSSVYTRRRRLRERIAASDSPYKEDLLKYL